MSKEINLHVNSAEGVATMMFGQALTPKEPLLINVIGTITAPRFFVAARCKILDPLTCRITVDRNMFKLDFVAHETDPYKRIIIGGSLSLSQEFDDFKINTGNHWSSFDLAEKIRMNRTCFESKEEAIGLVKILKDFKATVEKDIALQTDDRANYSMKRTQAVKNLSIPENITFSMPIFKGFPKMKFIVELIINPETLEISLVSPDAKDIVKDFSEKIMDDEINKMSEYLPGVAVLEL